MQEVWADKYAGFQVETVALLKKKVKRAHEKKSVCSKRVYFTIFSLIIPISIDYSCAHKCFCVGMTHVFVWSELKTNDRFVTGLLFAETS